MMEYALLRLDTEDYATPASNWALARLAEGLRTIGVRAVFPLVAEKLRYLEAWAADPGDAGEDARRALTALAWHEVGYHSNTHSLHPTIAEELEPLGWQVGRDVFVRREEQGWRKVAARFGPLACYTQPGANWTPQAFAALRGHVAMMYSEGWNSYLRFDGRPYYYGGQLTFSAPVPVPKPFFSDLPANLAEAARLWETGREHARRAAAAAVGGGPALVHAVAHPTELTSPVFWDFVNFGRGVNLGGPGTRGLTPAPLKPREEAERGLAALLTWLEARGPWWTIADLVRAFPDVLRQIVFTPPWVDALARAVLAQAAVGKVGYLTVEQAGTRVAVSAAEALDFLTRAVLGEERLVWRHIDGPVHDLRQAMAETAAPTNTAAAPGLAREVQVYATAHHALPATVAGTPLLALVPLMAAHWLGQALPDAVCRFTPLEHVRPEAELHWDWPIFAPGFRAPRLLELARRQTWTLKPAIARSE